MSKSYEKPVLDDVSMYGGAAEPYGVPAVVPVAFAAVLGVYVLVAQVVALAVVATNAAGIVHVAAGAVKVTMKNS